MKNIWSQYYERPAFLEGTMSAFDLFGQNSSFKSRTIQYDSFNDMQTLVNSIAKDFSEVGKVLGQSMKYFAGSHVGTK